MNFMTNPSSRWTTMAGSADWSMVAWYTLRTSDNDKMFAMDFRLYQTSPGLGKLPTVCESWKPPLVIAQST